MSSSMWKRIGRFGIGAMLMASSSLPLFAEDKSNEELLKKVEKLEARVKELEGKQDVKPMAAPKGEGAGDLESRLAAIEEKACNIGLKVSGSANVSYAWNFNRPNTRTSSLRVFDFEHSDFTVNLVDIVLEKPTAGPGTAGFRADIDVGEDAAIFQAAGFADGDNFELQQAYMEYVADIGRGLTFRMGKFVTYHGAEVIESADNWNTSRSFLFGFAEPGTHTGVHVTYPFSDAVTAMVGVVNGWDNVDDGNNGKTLHTMIKITPCKEFWGAVSYSYGPETVGEEDQKRWLLDVVLSTTPWEKWTFMVNADFAGQEDAGIGTEAGNDASWDGVAIYAKWDFAEQWYAGVRGEWFNDEEGARMGAVGQNVWEVTATLSRKWTEAMETRLEFRHDDSDKDVFADAAEGEMTDSQDTLSFEVIYRF